MNIRAKVASKCINEDIASRCYTTQNEHIQRRLVETTLKEFARTQKQLEFAFDDAFRAMAEFSQFAQGMWQAGGWLTFSSDDPSTFSSTKTNYLGAIMDVQGEGEGASLLKEAFESTTMVTDNGKKEAKAAAAVREYLILKQIYQSLPGLEQAISAGKAKYDAVSEVIDDTLQPLLRDVHSKLKKELNKIEAKATKTATPEAGTTTIEVLLYQAADKVRSSMSDLTGSSDPSLCFKALGDPEFEAAVIVAARVCLQATGRMLVSKVKECIITEKTMQARSNDGGRSHTMSDSTKKTLAKSKVWKAAHEKWDEYTVTRRALVELMQTGPTLDGGGAAGIGGGVAGVAAPPIAELLPLYTLVTEPGSLDCIETDGTTSSSQLAGRRKRLLAAFKKWAKMRSLQIGSRHACEAMINYSHTHARKGLRQLELAEVALSSCISIDGDLPSYDATEALAELSERLRRRKGAIPDKLSETALRGLAASFTNEASASLRRAESADCHIERMVTSHFRILRRFEPQAQTGGLHKQGSYGWIVEARAAVTLEIGKLQMMASSKFEVAPLLTAIGSDGGTVDDDFCEEARCLIEDMIDSGGVE
jgi:hypothetical protein